MTNESRKWMHLAFVQDGAMVKQDDKPLTGWRTDDGLRPSDEWLASEGYYGLLATEPPLVSREEGQAVLAPISEWPINESTKTVTQQWQVELWDETQKEQLLQQEWNAFRNERNRRLANTDWTQLADTANTIGIEWLNYRESLRDLPSNTENPYQPQWPLTPTEGE